MKIRQLAIRIPNEVHKKWKILLFENDKTAQEVMLQFITDISKNDEILIKKYLK